MYEFLLQIKKYRHYFQTKQVKVHQQKVTIIMDAIQNLPAHQQKEFIDRLEQMQMKDSLTMYSSLVHRCFNSCVYSFRSKTLDKSEASCVENCASRYVKSTQRVGLRFAEHQAMQQQRAAAAATTTQTR